MLNKQSLILIIMSLFYINSAHAFSFDARKYRLNIAVTNAYNWAQENEVQLSSALLAMYARFQANNYIVTDQQYREIQSELFAWTQTVAAQANARTISQEYIDANS